VRALIHRLADEGERIGELIDRPQLPFHFANRVENLVVQRGDRRPEFNNISAMVPIISAMVPIFPTGRVQPTRQIVYELIAPPAV
jgi:hypothetical protein